MATVIGSFDDLTTAQRVVDDLVMKGFKRYEVSLMANATSSDYARYFNPTADLPVDSTTNGDRPLTTGQGTSFGAVAGAVTGLIVGLGAFVIPGVGPIIAAGPLIAGLTGGAVGVVAGAATGGIVAALVNSGVPEEEAHLYAESVKRGGTIVLVKTDADSTNIARDVMRDHNAVDIVQRRTEWQAGNTYPNGSSDNIDTPIANTTPVYASDISDATFNAACKQHYTAFYGNDSGYTFESILPYYRYGSNLANDPRYASAIWSEVEADARRIWEERNPDDNWYNYNEAVHFGWDWTRQNGDTQPKRKAVEVPDEEVVSNPFSTAPAQAE